MHAAILEAPAGSARAWVVAAELLDQLLVAMDHAIAALDACFAVEIPSGACSCARKLTSSLRMGASIS